ncbi:unnamed protein product [Parajaminaea phylloscopi]
MDTLRSTVARFGFNNAGAPAHQSSDKPARSPYAQGIGNTGPVQTASLGTPTSDSLSRTTFYARIAAIFFFALALICAIVAAAFQSKWIGSTSGLTNFLLFANIAFLCLLAFLSLVPFLAQRGSGGKRIADLERALREDRVGIVGNAFCLIFGFVVALTQLISTLGAPACKDPAKDSHAKSSKGSEKDYQAALPSFCRTKRAETAFLWMGWICFLILGVLFFLQFRRGRKAGPRIPPFAHPGGSSEGGAFQPLGGDDDDDDNPYAGAPSAAEDDYRAAARYGAGPYDNYGAGYDAQASPAIPGGYGGGYGASVTNIESRYGLPGSQPHPDTQPGYGAPNPFADALANAQPMANRVPPSYDGAGPTSQQFEGYRQSYDYGAYSSQGHGAYGHRY